MAHREQAVRRLAERVAATDAVSDAWVAKSFTDLLLVVEVEEGPVPDHLVETLADEGLVGYNELHGVTAEDPASVGGLADGDRFRFVDRQSRGTQQSYVVE